ncbi:MAG: hypothetical protein KAV87_17950 [Desulfobacteraceae bacterium]|nr:hypothetical protein [Desulfobacteraceae bacterium]
MNLRSIIITCALVTLIMGTGWVKSIIKLADCDFESPYKAEITYAVGVVVPPVGMVTGWLNVGE